MYFCLTVQSEKFDLFAFVVGIQYYSNVLVKLKHTVLKDLQYVPLIFLPFTKAAALPLISMNKDIDILPG